MDWGPLGALLVGNGGRYWKFWRLSERFSGGRVRNGPLGCGDDEVIGGSGESFAGCCREGILYY